MRKFKTLIILAAAAACPILAGTSSAAGEYVHAAAVFAAGGYWGAAGETSLKDTVQSEAGADSSAETLDNPKELFSEAETAQTTESSTAETAETFLQTEEITEILSPPESGAGKVITQNADSVSEDLSGYDACDGDIIRESYGTSLGTDHITLSSGAQVRNMTNISAEELLSAAEELPKLRVSVVEDEPLVLIVHTHTTENYETIEREFYDESYPTRTRDCSQNICAVGEELAQALAENGISVVHDCTVHDYPAYTGAYDRSEETIKKALEDYPSIKIVIDLHRDATENAQGQRIAPCAEIEGKSAAQFMIIAGCDNGLFDMPNYMENFKLACLIQNTAQELYEGLARPVLFDYRNYNQHLTTGSLLIEVGSHASSLDEAKYTGELLGKILAKTIDKISE